jgi:hypothetical protein
MIPKSSRRWLLPKYGSSLFIITTLACFFTLASTAFASDTPTAVEAPPAVANVAPAVVPGSVSVEMPNAGDLCAKQETRAECYSRIARLHDDELSMGFLAGMAASASLRDYVKIYDEKFTVDPIALEKDRSSACFSLFYISVTTNQAARHLQDLSAQTGSTSENELLVQWKMMGALALQSTDFCDGEDQDPLKQRAQKALDLLHEMEALRKDLNKKTDELSKLAKIPETKI